MAKLGLIGVGYWGPNYINTLRDFPDVQLAWCCDKSEGALKTARDRGLRTTTDEKELFTDPALDGIIIATPTATHYRIARDALQAGKHVLVEKPVTMSSTECGELERLAASAGKILMAGHTYLYNDGVRYLDGHIHDKEKFGDIQAIECYWQSHGAFRTDMNVIWDLAPHGVSVANYLAHCLPTSVRALCLKADASRTKEESALIHMQYPDFSAIVKANWQYPLKERKVIAVGTKQMIQFDDVNNATPISIFEKSAIPHGIRPGADYGSFKLITRDGGTYLPVVKLRAPLQTQLVDFYEAMRTGKAPLASARNGAEVVRILEATDESLRNNGGEVPLTW